MPITNLPGAEQYVLQQALAAVTDEAYTTAKRIDQTGIVGESEGIDPATKTFTGQLSWKKPLNPVINTVSLTDQTYGATTDFSSGFSSYVKALRSHGHKMVTQASVVSGEQSLTKIATDFATTRANEESDSLLAVLRGVMISEALTGAAAGSGAAGLGGQTFDNDPNNAANGFYVDLGANPLVAPASVSMQGASRCASLLQALGMGFKDYEPDYLYLTCTPSLLADLRSANMVDETTVTEGNITFDTLLGGKFRLIRTRSNFGLTTAQLAKINSGPGVDIVGTKAAFLIRPGSVAMKALQPELPVEITRDASTYKGGGSSHTWYRWGYVIAPWGYDWVGNDKKFAEQSDYLSVKSGSTVSALTDAASIATTTGVFRRATASALSLGILPVFHG